MGSGVRIHAQLDPPKSLFGLWTFDNPRRVSIGFSPNASIWLFDPDAGYARDIFVRKGGEIRFLVSTDLKAELTIGEREISIEALKSRGLLKTFRGREYVPLKEKTEGAFTLGSTKVRFWIAPVPADTEYPKIFFLLRWLRATPLLFVLLLAISAGLELKGFRYLASMPVPPEPTLNEVTRRFARLYLPTRNFLAKRFARQGTGKEPEHPAPPSEDRRRKPLAPEGFLAAVVSSRVSGKASPFASLFATRSIGSDLSRALRGRSLDDAVTEALKRIGGGASPVEGPAPSAVDIGSLRQRNLKEARLDKEASIPSLVRLSVTTDSAQASGAFDPDLLSRVIQSHAEELRDCYERALVRKPGLAGKVLIRLLVGPDGRAKNTDVLRSTVGDRGLESCILERIATWSFPLPEGERNAVQFPLIFTPASQE